MSKFEGNKEESNNHRSIWVIMSTSRVFLRIVKKKIKTKVQELNVDNNRQCLETYITSIDYKKAYIMLSNI